MTRALVIAVVPLVGLLGLRAQAPPQGAAQQTLPPLPDPTFHVGVDAVRIDAIVTDKHGRVVTDLTADDFELRQDGYPVVTLAQYARVGACDDRVARSAVGAGLRHRSGAPTSSTADTRPSSANHRPRRGRPRPVVGDHPQHPPGHARVYRRARPARRSRWHPQDQHVFRRAAAVHDGQAPAARHRGPGAVDGALAARGGAVPTLPAVTRRLRRGRDGQAHQRQGRRAWHGGPGGQQGAHHAERADHVSSREHGSSRAAR